MPTKRTILVTGANRGIGLETVRELARSGLSVTVAARRKDAADRVAKELKADGGEAMGLELDVSSSASIKAAAAEFGKQHESLDVLINNAAIYPDEGFTILTLPRDQGVATFQTNVFGPIEVTQAFLPYLRKGHDARVINLSSGYGQLDGMSPNVPSYCLSKLTINGFSIMLADALKGEGIAVNSMCPGWVRTDMGGPNATRSVEEGADTAVWLATEASQKLTGKFFRDRREISW